MIYDVAIIGAGHNGLITAAYLAQAGKNVVIIEQNPFPGGAAVTSEVFKGFKYSVFSYAVSLLSPQIINELNLNKNGLEILPLKSTFTPLNDNKYLLRTDDPHQTSIEISKYSQHDASNYPKFLLMMSRMAEAIKPILSMIPPNPWKMKISNLAKLLRLSKHAYSLGQDDFYTLLKLMTMSASSFLDEWFESEPLKGTLASSGIIGTFLGPRSPGTAYIMLHHYMGELDGKYRTWGIPKGGMGAISDAIERTAVKYGTKLYYSSKVVRINCEQNIAKSITLSDGKNILAKQIASSLDPHYTFLNLIDKSHLPQDFLNNIKSYKIQGSSGKINLSLDSLPTFKCLPHNGQHLKGAISISPSVDYLENAYDEAKNGYISSEPYLDVLIPSTLDSSISPPNKHVMSIFVQYAPYYLKNGWGVTEKNKLTENVISTLEKYVPNIRNIILHKQTLTPLDIEQKIGMTQGNIFHGELTPHQLFFMRPTIGYGDYKTPIKGLFICGSGSHPGGGVSGYPGRNAAKTILANS